MRPGEGDSASITVLADQVVDWGWFHRAAKGHGVLPLAYRRLVAAGIDPPGMGDTAAAIARTNLRLTAELAAIARDFSQAGIPLLAWKGPTLALQLWGDLGHRQFRDLDLLVHPQGIGPAVALLEGRGYALATPVTGARGRGLLRRDCEAVFIRHGTADRVELHWAFVPPWAVFGLGTAEAWSRRQAVPLGGEEIWSLAPEDLFLSLAAHGTRHAWERLGWIVDVGQLAASPELDWEMLLARARALHAERMTLLAASLAHRLLSARMPSVLARRQAGHPSLPTLTDWVASRLFVDEPGHLRPGPRRALQLLARERLRDRMRMVLRSALAVGEGDWEALPLPDRCYPLYFLIRPLRLAWRFGAGFIRTLGHERGGGAREGDRPG